MKKTKESVATGIVIGNRIYRENDKSVTLFSKDLGKMSFVARGVRKLTSKNKSSTDLFVYGDYHLTKGKAYQILTQGEVLESFLFLRKDLDKMGVAMAMSTFLNDVLPEHVPHDSVFDLFYWSLKRLETTKDPLFLMRYFLVKAIYYLGYSPDLSGCSVCGNKDGPYYFKFQDGQITCVNCTNEGFFMEGKLVEFYQYLETDAFQAIHHLALEKNNFEKFDSFLERWIECIIEKRFNGFIFLKKLKF